MSHAPLLVVWLRYADARKGGAGAGRVGGDAERALQVARARHDGQLRGGAGGRAAHHGLRHDGPGLHQRRHAAAESGAQQPRQQQRPRRPRHRGQEEDQAAAADPSCRAR